MARYIFPLVFFFISNYQFYCFKVVPSNFIPWRIGSLSVLRSDKPITKLQAIAEPSLKDWSAFEKELVFEKMSSYLTLYRDTNGWCPFCERVWLCLIEKNIPFREELIDLRNKPSWYKEIVPTNLVPALKNSENGDVIWESIDIIKYIENTQPGKALLPTDKFLYEESMRLFDHCAYFLNQTLGYLYNKDQKIEKEKEEMFLNAMKEVDEILSRKGGPFFLGKNFSAVDAMYVPFLERYAVQVPLLKSLKVCDNSDWPNIKNWFQAMDNVPGYQRVKGDEYSWTAVTSMFMKMFGNGSVSEDAIQKGRETDSKAVEILDYLEKNKQEDCSETTKDARLVAARVILANREAIIYDATSLAPKTQPDLQRCNSPAVVNLLLRATVCLLIADAVDFEQQLEYVSKQLVSSTTNVEISNAARYIAKRLCAPRDMGALSATQLRMVLLKLAKKVEQKVNNLPAI